jgi:hypothetical protein
MPQSPGISKSSVFLSLTFQFHYVTLYDGTEDSREIRLNDLVIRFTIVLANTPLLRTDLDNANRELAATKRENELLRIDLERFHRGRGETWEW